VLQPAGPARPKANRLAALEPRADRRQHDHAHTARTPHPPARARFVLTMSSRTSNGEPPGGASPQPHRR
jgi:hypothetical protein